MLNLPLEWKMNSVVLGGAGSGVSERVMGKGGKGRSFGGFRGTK